MRRVNCKAPSDELRLQPNIRSIPGAVLYEATEQIKRSPVNKIQTACSSVFSSETQPTDESSNEAGAVLFWK